MTITHNLYQALYGRLLIALGRSKTAPTSAKRSLFHKKGSVAPFRNTPFSVLESPIDKMPYVRKNNV